MTHDAAYVALVGIDWADAKHDFWPRVIGADPEAYGVLGHLPAASAPWARAVAARFPGSKIAVCLEQSPGSLLDALLKADHGVL
jgi:hypothetical protein